VDLLPSRRDSSLGDLSATSFPPVQSNRFWTFGTISLQVSEKDTYPSRGIVTLVITLRNYSQPIPFFPQDRSTLRSLCHRVALSSNSLRIHARITVSCLNFDLKKKKEKRIIIWIKEVSLKTIDRRRINQESGN